MTHDAATGESTRDLKFLLLCWKVRDWNMKIVDVYSTELFIQLATISFVVKSSI
jgi:hypothetical protein